METHWAADVLKTLKKFTKILKCGFKLSRDRLIIIMQYDLDRRPQS